MSAARRRTVATLLMVWSAPLTLLAQERAGTASDLAEGARLYARNCAPCHGASGEGGRGPTLATPRLLRAADATALATLIRRGIEGTEMPGTGMSDAGTRLVAAWVLALGRRPQERVPGDAVRGERVFKTTGACSTCHTLRGHGGAFGPDLTDIGARRGAAYLRASLTDPGAQVPRSASMYGSDISISDSFLQVRLTTRGGRQMLGLRVNEDTFSIQVRDPSGALHSFFKSELLELHKDWGRSPMPSYASVLSKEQLDDLVAFLASLRGD